MNVTVKEILYIYLTITQFEYVYMYMKVIKYRETLIL